MSQNHTLRNSFSSTHNMLYIRIRLGFAAGRYGKDDISSLHGLDPSLFGIPPNANGATMAVSPEAPGSQSRRQYLRVHIPKSPAYHCVQSWCQKVDMFDRSMCFTIEDATVLNVRVINNICAV